MLTYLCFFSEIAESRGMNDRKGGLREVLKHIVMTTLLTSALLLGACQTDENVEGKDSTKTVKPKDLEMEELPEQRAFQDEFTRGFLTSTEETRPGYYPFLSATGAFVMDFPEAGIIAEKLYHSRNQSFEMMRINVGNETSDILHTIRIQYTGHLEEDIHKKTSLGMLHSELEGVLDFERVEEDEQIYHISGFELEKDEDYNDVYGYAALIFHKQSQGGIEIVYHSHCLDNCDDLRESDEQTMYDWIKSVQFLENSDESKEDK